MTSKVPVAFWPTVQLYLMVTVVRVRQHRRGYQHSPGKAHPKPSCIWGDVCDVVGFMDSLEASPTLGHFSVRAAAPSQHQGTCFGELQKAW